MSSSVWFSRRFKARSGIVDQDVQTAEAAVRCLHHSFDLIPLRHIGGRKDRLDPP